MVFIIHAEIFSIGDGLFSMRVSKSYQIILLYIFDDSFSKSLGNIEDNSFCDKYISITIQCQGKIKNELNMIGFAMFIDCLTKTMPTVGYYRIA